MNTENTNAPPHYKGNDPDIDRNFLEKIIPSDGTYIMFRLKRTPGEGEPPEKGNISSIKLDKMVEDLTRLRERGCDVYHANASFKNGKTRSAVNAKSMKSLFLDLDCGDAKAEKGDGYVTKEEAVTELFKFGRLLGLPRPMVIDSGGGLHIYWTFEKEVPVSEWTPVAQGLKALCKACGLLADPSVTADAARLLRPVGSHNTKYDPPRLVKMIKDAEPHSFSDLRTIIDAASDQYLSGSGNSITRAARKPQDTDVPDSLAKQVNPIRYDLNDVEEALKRIDPSCRRYQWLPVGMAIADAFGEVGRELFLQWSRGDLWETE
jgi:hypothetical protein